VKIISADARLAQRRGVKFLTLGPTGVGKTSLMRTIPDPSRILYGDGEGGDLAIQDLPVTAVRIEDWPTARDLACRIGGPNPSYGANACYSEAHYNAIGGPLENLERYELICFDSVTAISRLSYRWSEQQPEAFARSGGKDTRAAYGIHAREMLAWLHQLQRARDKHIVFIGIIEKITDEFNRHLGFQLQAEGQRVPREISAIVDEIVVLEWLSFGDGKPPARGFVCTSPNRWGYPAKDRSGRLDEIEPPHLGKLIAKITNPVTVSPVKADAAE
jgi:AAA domain